jgi:hypothetical protein
MIHNNFLQEAMPEVIGKEGIAQNAPWTWFMITIAEAPEASANFAFFVNLHLPL